MTDSANVVGAVKATMPDAHFHGTRRFNADDHRLVRRALQARPKPDFRRKNIGLENEKRVRSVRCAERPFAFPERLN